MKHLPDTKIERIYEKSDDVSDDIKKGKVDFDILRANGIDSQIGLSYCQNDEAFYRSLLADYAAGKEEKISLLEKYKAVSDWHNYMIHVHSLKSSSKMIGAVKMSEQAARLEAAAGNEDGTAIIKEHDDMIKRYEETVRAIESILSTKHSSDDDGEILEFFPER